jgi:hypothetical protein
VSDKQRMQRSTIEKVYGVNNELKSFLSVSSVAPYSPRSEISWAEKSNLKASRKTTAFGDASNFYETQNQGSSQFLKPTYESTRRTEH